jgi:hypothetical protein
MRTKVGYVKTFVFQEPVKPSNPVFVKSASTSGSAVCASEVATIRFASVGATMVTVAVSLPA